MAFSNSNGYFFFVPESLSSNPENTDGNPLYPKRLPKAPAKPLNLKTHCSRPQLNPSNYWHLLVVVVECNPLHPLARFLDELDELDDVDPVDGIVSNSRFFIINRPPWAGILLAANSVNKSFGTRINNNFGTLLMKKLRTHGAILWVLGLR